MHFEMKKIHMKVKKIIFGRGWLQRPMTLLTDGRSFTVQQAL